MFRLAVMISGSGRTLDHLAKYYKRSSSVKIALVIATKSGCEGIEIAKKHGLTVVEKPRSDWGADDEWSQSISVALNAFNIEGVAMAGCIHHYIVPQKYQWRVLNIHPSLTPSFSGKGYYGGQSHREAYERGVKVSGCTVHFVTNEYDAGPIIIQRACDIEFGDGPEEIAAKVFEQEKIAYPEAIYLLANSLLHVVKGRVQCEGQ
jgi:phosphoribosylglycinamide formyltransferase 1